MLPMLRLLTLLTIVSSSLAADYFPPPDSEGGWREAKSVEAAQNLAGIDLAKLEPAWAITENSSAHGGLLIVRRGYLCFERYFGRASRNVNPDMASTGKAVCSIACGIMLAEYRDQIPQGLDTKVFTQQYLPEAFPLDDPRKADISLGQLLCMTAGYWGEGLAPTGYRQGKPTPEKLKQVKGQDIRNLDQSSLRVPLWTAPGTGYSYSSPSPHIASIVLRHVTGMELKDYVHEKLAKPMGWGPWNYCLQRGDFLMPHANGAGSTALRATDALRFGYCLMKNGKWKDQQVVPADYIAKCQTHSPYNPHTPWSLQFEHNADGHVIGVPKDAFFKSGANGFCIIMVPSEDLVIYKLGGKTAQYEPKLTGIPQPEMKKDRDTWEPSVANGFTEGSLTGDSGIRRVIGLVCAAIRLETK
jgi:CubicO group peptidase (beta-lactamase class C family)